MQEKRKDLKGSALVYGLVIMFAVSVILTSLIGFIISQTKYGFHEVSKQEAFQIAENGVSFYRWYLAHMVEGRTALQIKDFWETGNPLGVATAYEAEYFDPGGSAIGKYSITVTPPSDGSTTMTLVSTGWTYKYPDTKKVLRVRFRRPSWSEYMVLSHDMFRLSSGTTVHGKLHSNNGIHFDGVAHNMVTSAVSQYFDTDNDVNAQKPGVWTSWANEYNTSLGSSVFMAGKEYPVTSQDFNGLIADLSLIKSEAQTGNGKYFDNTGEGRHITLKTDDTYDVCTVDKYTSPNGNAYGANTYNITKYRKNGGIGTCNTCAGQCLSNYPIPNNGVIYVEDNIWLNGQIDGERLTVAAADLIGATDPKVIIGQNVKYTNYDGSDILGVMAEGDVEIPGASNNVLDIDGALLAQKGRVGRKNYGNVKSTITINGAIASHGRIGFGFTDGTGYTTRNLYYDNNLLYYPPPYFPTGTQYLMDLWEEL